MRVHEPVLNGGIQKRLLPLSTNAATEIERRVLISNLSLCEDSWWTVGKEDFLSLHLFGGLEKWRQLFVCDTRAICHFELTATPTHIRRRWSAFEVRAGLIQTIEHEQPHGYSGHEQENADDDKPFSRAFVVHDETFLERCDVEAETFDVSASTSNGISTCSAARCNRLRSHRCRPCSQSCSSH